MRQSAPQALTSKQPGLAGLSMQDAHARLDQYGPNLLPEPRAPSAFAIFIRQFRSPLIYILLFAAVVSLFVSDVQDAIFISIVLLVNGVIGTVQEYSAARAASALRKLEQPHATVLRDGAALEIESRDVVPGDIIMLEAGSRIPADLVLLEATDLECDESLLTGEPLPVRKSAGTEPLEADNHPEDRAFAGTLITRGRGIGRATATGPFTQMGQIAAAIAEPSVSQPPLMVRLSRFSTIIAWSVGIALILLVCVGLIRGIGWDELFLMSVGLAVSAIPEGLPIAISIALAISMRRLAKHNVIVRSMPAVESLGSCTMIATDKTGTLTLNELTVTDLRLPDGTEVSLRAGANPDTSTPPETREKISRLMRAAALPNGAVLIQEGDELKGLGDAVDIALLAAAQTIGLSPRSLKDDYPLINRIPYEPDRKYAASFHREHGHIRVFVKGAPETLVDMADRMETGAATAQIDRGLLLAQKEEMAARGLKVLAFAEGEISTGINGPFGHQHLKNLVILGLIGMQDPLRPEVKPAIRRCIAAGVAVAMVTGDDPKTAATIAAEAGLTLEPEQIVTGDEVRNAEAVGPDELDKLTRFAKIYARVAPAQKLAIVLSMTRNGHFVAVTGDGINDAPALRHAHVGVAMGRRGTDVAKESADIVITDDNFASIVSGISEGRTAYANIRKVILMVVSTGAAEVLLFLLALPLGLPMPLLPVQLLWLNLVTNGIQDVALAGEKPEGNELIHAPRRPGEPIFDRLMIRRVIQSATIIGCGGVAAFYWLLSQGYEVSQARNLLLLLFVTFENVQTFTSRSEHRSIFSLSPFGNPLLLASIAGAQFLHISAMHIPWLSGTLQLAPISLLEWVLTLAAASSIIIVTEVDKLYSRHRNGFGNSSRATS
ncbi:HAD-IC family P-type ATPase [Agrobacterium sp. DE0009]|uniref:cation-translocating P-type ATPase n=1 Tax=Agrobacterium sp. DE0009 TaxID=2587505 RepID=UPI0011A07E3F|nr:HAD-IC family P-type ATPase [Agrobacterium sp. DE0009]